MLMKKMDEVDENKDLEILNLVHQLASQSWRDGSPSSLSAAEVPFSSNSPRHGGTTNYSNKIAPKLILDVRKVKEEPRLGRRIQPISIPRKPPDIQNLLLFPPIGDSTVTSPPGKIYEKHSEIETNAFMKSAGQSFENNNSILINNSQKLKQLESKLRGQSAPEIKTTPVKNRQRKSLESSPASPQNVSPLTLTPKSEDGKNRMIKELRKAPRSAELFAELTPELIAEVDSIAEQYSSLIDNNLCRSVLEELMFLLKLISSCGAAKCVSMQRIGQLSTVAQQVYFVIKVLSLQLDSTLTAVDPKIIQLLIQKYPHRIPKLIRKHFEKWAASQMAKKEMVEPEPLSSQKPSEYHQCVTFRSETDGRPNFPNQGDFHAFCKQRDLFYSIKNLWADREQMSFAETESVPKVTSTFMKNPRNNTSSRDPDALYPKIKALFNMNSSWGNLSHLASLFTSQYLLDSEKRPSPDEAIKDEQMRNLLRSNPNRLAQLQNRMSTATIASHSTIGTRYEDPLAFSKYFLSIANSAAFNQHLIDRITFEISQIETSVEESTESFQPNETELLLRNCILLAKLLGYLVFLPYKDDGPNNKIHHLTLTIDKEALISKQIELRSYQRPPIDLKSKLVIAYQQKRLVFTLPWIIEFLSEADPVSLSLPVFKETISLIYFIYRSYLKLGIEQVSVSAMNLNFLRFWCGSLFSLEKFPDSLLYSKDDGRILNELHTRIPGDRSGSQQSKDDQETALDLCDALGNKFVGLHFASQFSKMECILHAGLQQQEITLPGSMSATLEVKHIRPVPAKSPIKSSTVSKTVQLQLQLEASFFDSNSPSVKKTVDFIAERIASNYVKTLRTRMSEERYKLAELGIFEDDAASACRKIMVDQLNEFSEKNCNESVIILIGETISPSALCVCQQITLRKCSDKVNEWIANHIKAEMFPVFEASTSVTSSSKKEQTEERRGSTEEDTTADCKLKFEAMILLHSCLKKLHKGNPISEDSLDEILTSRSLQDEPAIAGTIIDFGMALVTYCPSMLTSKRQEKLICIWKKYWSNDCKVLNPRNLVMIQESRESGTESWEVLTALVKSLINSKVLSLEELEQDCLTLLRQDWPSTLFSHLSRFLKELVSSFNVSTTRDQESRELIDWVAWYCSNEFD